MLNKIKYLVVGSPLPNEMLQSKRLNKVRALAAFSPDALSSVAYANQEIFLALAVAGPLGLSYQFPIAIGITLLLSIVALSYAQTIRAYPNGGGSYVVAHENLGTYPGLVAGGALLLDYILTAAVSLTAGVAAIASAFPALWQHKVWLALGLLLLITLINMRGIRESGTLLSIPVFLFILSFGGMILFGLVRLLFEGAPAVPPGQLTVNGGTPLTIVLLLHAFSTGCTALTGIESISNGTPSFKPPEWLNAQKTLMIMAVLMGFFFLGSIGLTQIYQISPIGEETVLSALARVLFGNNIFYYVIQTSTLLILAVAANTSFAGFPRVAAIMAKDKYLPRQLFNLGDRLVFNNGIALLAISTAVLILIFNGESHALIPLFAVGAFTAFTLSQCGMVVHWLHNREKGWWLKAIVNGLGAAVTFVTLGIISYSKFTQGAWISILLIIFMIYIFITIRRHYQEVSRKLSMHGLPPSLRPWQPPRVVIPISGVHRGMIDAVNFARSISDRVTAIYVDMDPGPDEEELRKRWNEWFPDVDFVVIPSPYRSLVDPLLKYLDETDQQHNDGQQAVLVLPEVIPGSSLQEVLHNQSATEIKRAILYQRRHHGLNRIIIDVPYQL
ncbi:MAG: APC family permease [Anaerolineaceae bacterium]|nr:APC family permease [Anaerolineaceae bacterium]